MCIPATDTARAFLAPLKGSVAMLLLHDRETKMALSRLLLRCAYLQAASTCILDADAFYCTNIDRLTDKMDYDDRFLTETQMLLLPEEPFKVSYLTPLVSSKTRLLVLDDVNSLYSLASDMRRSHELSVLMKILSHNAKMNASWVIATAYRAERGAQASTNGRSLAGLGDLLVESELRDGSLILKAKFEGPWPNGELRL